MSSLLIKNKMGLRSYFQNRILQKKELENVRKKDIKNLLSMKSLLALISVDTNEEKEVWKRYFENISSNFEKVDVLFYVVKKSVNPIEDEKEEDTIYTHQLNLSGSLKNNNRTDVYTDYSYDLIIDINFDDIYILNYMFVKSVASLKVCAEQRTRHHQVSDLLIKTDLAEEKQKLYIDQIFYYLQQINANGHSKT